LILKVDEYGGLGFKALRSVLIKLSVWWP